MDNDSSKFFLALFPFLFVGGWLLISTFLMMKAGWFDLARKYPDRNDTALRKLRLQSGKMSGVSMSRILRFEPCDTGLRVGMSKLFGPFCRDFFVPWDQIRVKRRDRFIWRIAELTFGNGPENLILMDYVANRLARSAGSNWPETGSFEKETFGQAAWATFKIWALVTTGAALFFSLAPRLLSPIDAETYPPIEFTIGFPALIFGLTAVGQFYARIKE